MSTQAESAPKPLIQEIQSTQSTSNDWLNEKDSNYSQFDVSAKPKPASAVSDIKEQMAELERQRKELLEQ